MPKREGGLGFRDMAKFNIAMLCKQAWKLLKNTNSLVFKVLQAKYFPRKSFMEAKQGYNSSFTWQSIWATKKLLEKGIRWRVGNGAQIRIWKDPWIPKLSRFIPRRLDMEEGDEARVSKLIDEDRYQWDRQKIDQFFSKEIGLMIQAIPLGTPHDEDTLVWDNEEHGCYTVKSGYRLLMEGQADVGIRQTERNGNQREIMGRFWKKLWKAKVPSKIQLCIWRSAHDLLPVLVNLNKRKVCLQKTCPLCGADEETTFHAIRTCKVASKVWMKLQLHEKWSITDNTNMLGWISKVTDKMDSECFEFGLIVIWAIWMSRNAVVMNGDTRDSYGITKFAMQFYQEYKNAIKWDEKSDSREVQKWKKPPQGIIKINFDGSFKVAERKGGIGVIARDDKGDIVGAAQAINQGITDPLVVEATAAIRALMFAKDMGFTRIILEGDALMLITKILQAQPSLSVIGNLVAAAKDLMKQFNWSKIQHVQREANEAAHCLAKNALSIEEDLYWVDECPAFLLPVLTNDCN